MCASWHGRKSAFSCTCVDYKQAFQCDTATHTTAYTTVGRAAPVWCGTSCTGSPAEVPIRCGGPHSGRDRLLSSWSLPRASPLGKNTSFHTSEYLTDQRGCQFLKGLALQEYGIEGLMTRHILVQISMMAKGIHSILWQVLGNPWRPNSFRWCYVGNTRVSLCSMSRRVKNKHKKFLCTVLTHYQVKSEVGEPQATAPRLWGKR